MLFERTRLPVRKLVEGWRTGSLVRNPDYQRGQAWGPAQKQALIDSLFRMYPIPPIFLEEKTSEGLFGGGAQKHEVIDGQQRILSLQAYFDDELELLDPADPRLRLPFSLRTHPAPWKGRRYSQLDRDLKVTLDSFELDVFLVREVQHEDEVRDLFIRLQSGTALTRQQIRDAWPGRVGPLIEAMAGKLAKHPKYRLFQAVDGRGTRDDEDDPRDPYVKHRQTCAQLMRLLIARMSDPRHFPSVEASDVDGFYHEQTSIDPNGPAIQEIERVFSHTQEVTEILRAGWSGRRKLPKLTMFCLAFFFQDMLRNEYFKFNAAAYRRLAEFAAEVTPARGSRNVSGPAVRQFYASFLAEMPDDVGFVLDERRLFDGPQKAEIRQRDDSRCQICLKPASEDEEEYDHHPLPHRLGGRTEVSNGRLVHRDCHPRGRPKAE